MTDADKSIYEEFCVHEWDFGSERKFNIDFPGGEVFLDIRPPYRVSIRI
jgi:hypothetical protein